MRMLSTTFKQTLSRARDFAASRYRADLTLEDLLLALTDDPDAVDFLVRSGIDVDGLRDDLLLHFSDEPGGASRSVEALQPTQRFRRVMERAAVEAKRNGGGEITGEYVLLSLLYDREAGATQFLVKHRLTFPDRDGLRPDYDPAEAGDRPEAEPDGGDAPAPDDRATTRTALEAFCVNLRDKVALGRIDPLIGRDAEVERTVQVLCRRTKNNPLYVGEPGVGKTAIAEGLARRIAEGDVPEALAGTTIYSLDMGALLAGTRYRGDFEERLKRVIGELDGRDDAVLFIDEIHTMIGAGGTSGGAMDAANLLKPALQSGAVKCIGSTTYKEYRNHFEKDRALVRRFQKIDVNEPGLADAVKILRGLKPAYEAHHGVRYTVEALRAAVELSARYIGDRKLPDKAIDVIDEAGAAQKLAAGSRRRKTVGVKQVEAVVARIARIPARRVSSDDRESLRNLESDLRAVVFGQDPAIEALAGSIKLARAGLREPDKPTGCYVFSGPTGVGKTEVTRRLALVLGVELIRFDMSEYMEGHSVSRLLGAPPGYVGFDQGGLLTDAVDQHPHCVLLLDEIEKAHPSLFNLLLQVMDNGRLTDNNGKVVDFRNVILVMTTNAGAADMAKPAIGFGRERREGEDQAAIERLFAPEFRNRLDAVIGFRSLTPALMGLVVDKFIGELAAQVVERKVTVELGDGARAWLAAEGFDPLFGARPLARVIQERVKKPLAEELLFGRLAAGGAVRIDSGPDGLVFSYPDSPI